MIHTVGPVYSPAEDRSALLTACHTNALRVADTLGATTVAFPAISTGIYGWPLPSAAHIAIAAVLNTPTQVKQVTFVLFDDTAYETFQTTWQAWPQ